MPKSKVRRGNPHLDERELDRLGKIGDPFSTWTRKGMPGRQRVRRKNKTRPSPR